MFTLLDALLCLTEFVTGFVFCIFAVAGLYVGAEFWQAHESRLTRLGALLFTCMLALATAVLVADANRHLGEVLRAFL